MTLKRKIAIAIVFLVFILLNPSIKQFKDYVGSNSYKGLRRHKNWFIFSIFKDGDEEEYVGALSNFFPIAKHDSETSMDSVSVLSDTITYAEGDTITPYINAGK